MNVRRGAGPWRNSDLGAIARHGAAVLVGQLAVVAYSLTDTLVAGRLANSDLATLSVGTAVYVSVFVSLLGMLQVTIPVWAEMRGAQRNPQIGHSVRQSLYLCGIAVALGMAALWHVQPVLRWTRVPEALQAEVLHYLEVLSLALAPSLLFRMYANLNQALGKPLLVTWLQLGSLALKLPLTAWFAFGGAGLAPMGLAGCAWATVVVNLLMLAVALMLLKTHPLYAPLGLFNGWSPPDGRHLGQLLRQGVPGGLSVLVEVTAFTLMALLIARMGATASGAHQIAANLATLLYMVPLSLGIATSARVSHRLGEGRPDLARQAVRAGYTLAAFTAVGLSSALWWGANALPHAYTHNASVTQAATGLLHWVVAYHLVDTVQALSLFILRCYRVTLLPLAIYCLLLWGVGIGGGHWLANEGVPGWSLPWASPDAFWACSVTALTVVAVLFAALVQRTGAATTPSSV